MESTSCVANQIAHPPESGPVGYANIISTTSLYGWPALWKPFPLNSVSEDIIDYCVKPDRIPLFLPSLYFTVDPGLTVNC